MRSTLEAPPPAPNTFVPANPISCSRERLPRPLGTECLRPGNYTPRIGSRLRQLHPPLCTDRGWGQKRGQLSEKVHSIGGLPAITGSSTTCRTIPAFQPPIP